jgi:hypothetical protein
MLFRSLLSPGGDYQTYISDQANLGDHYGGYRKFVESHISPQKRVEIWGTRAFLSVIPEGNLLLVRRAKLIAGVSETGLRRQADSLRE